MILSMVINHIAFYGTLKQSGKTPVHNVIKNDLAFVGNCIIPGKLYNQGKYPAIEDGPRPIKGELYKIKNSSALSELDKYEATDHDDPLSLGFSRQSIQLLKPSLKAWIYHYNGKVNSHHLLRSNHWD